MKFFFLIFINFKRKKIRTILTVGSYLTAFFLFGLLCAVKNAFKQGVEVAGVDRLLVINKTSIIMPLPLSYKEKIKEIEGIKEVTYASWFGGYYQDQKNFFAQLAIEPDTFFKVYSEYKIKKEDFNDFLKDKEGAIVGRDTAKRFNFKKGDRIPIIAPHFGGVWEFNIRGIYEGTKKEDDLTQFFFHASYLEERRPWGKGMVGWYIVKIADIENSYAISKKIDLLFENSSYETKTESEKTFASGFVRQIADIEFIILVIGGVVFFTLLIVTLNTMIISVKERSPEIGILKTIGFDNKSLYLITISEALLYSLSGGIPGLILSKIYTLKGDPTKGFLPLFYISSNNILLGLIIATIFGIISGYFGARNVYKLKVVELLTRV